MIDGMPRFTVKDLLIATTVIAIGAGMFGLVPVVLGTDPARPPWWARYYLFGSVAMIGAGFGIPFHRPLVGAVCGIVLFILLVAAFAI